MNKDGFIALYKNISESKEFAPGQLECSVNVISENVYEHARSDGTQYIRRMVFIKGALVSDSYHTKSRIANVHINDYIKWSLGLSKETTVKSFATNNDAMMRFKARVSFDYIAGGGDTSTTSTPPKWRFDLTAVKKGSLGSLGPSLKTIKNELFTPALAADNFTRELNHDMIDEYEVEIEYVGAPSEIDVADLAIVKKLFTLVNPDYLTTIAYQEEINHVAGHIVGDRIMKNLSLKQLSNQVIALSKNTYLTEVYPPVGYYVTDKADGKRAIVSVNGNRCRVLMSDTMTEVTSGKSDQNDTSVQFTPGDITIADVERVDDGKTITLWIFDVMVYKSQNVSAEGFTNRIGYIEKTADLLNKMGVTAVAKQFVRIDDNIEKSIREIHDAEHPYVIDGLILTEPGAGYSQTRNYKWKPYDRVTIDFLAVRCPSSLLGTPPYVDKPAAGDQPAGILHLLFVGIDHEQRARLGLGLLPVYKQLFPTVDPQYYPIQFSPSADPTAYLYWHQDNSIDRKIIELGKTDTATPQWVFHRERTDRRFEKNFYGNDFRIAELTYLNFIDRFDLADLWKGSSGYFSKQADDIYTASNKYKRFVISTLLKDNYTGSKWIIDEASGRGADVHRYQEIGVENALFIEVDPTAVAELIRRRYAFAKQKRRGGIEKTVTGFDRVHQIEYDKLIVKDVKSLTIHTLVADLKTEGLVEKVYRYGINPGMADGIVCNFALHYLCDTVEHIRQILKFNATMLRTGGLFMFTVMDGEKIFGLLSKLATGAQYTIVENGVIKYAVKKLYRGDKLAATGQNIAVKMPFTDEMYEEPLCNVTMVIAEATRLGFALELDSSMTTHMGKFEQANSTLYAKLTEQDKEYIALHRYITLRKVSQPSTKK